MALIKLTVQDEATPPPQEKWFTVPSAVSTKNIFAGLSVPQNPGLGKNNWSSPHQDSYCTESVSLTGPTSPHLKLIIQENRYGFTPCMVCNENNQMIGISLNESEIFHLIVFDASCRILAKAPTNLYNKNSFGGGYFYQDNNDNTIAIHFNNSLASYPTSKVEDKGEPYNLSPLWVSDDIVKLITGSSKNNSLYSAMPVWDSSNPNLYWCLLAGEYDYTSQNPTLTSCAYMAVVQIVPDNQGNATTTLMAYYKLDNQWNNNTFSVDENGAYFVTNGVTRNNEEGYDPSTEGFCWGLHYNASEQKIEQIFRSPYENCGWLKTGQKNIGSGTTPTLLTAGDGTPCVAITDNATPRMNVVVFNRIDGSLLKQTPVFPDRRSCDEASLIGINNRLVVENNFGHTATPYQSQLVMNEPGLAMLTVTDDAPQNKEPVNSQTSELLWEDSRNTFFAMTMLARESGIIFAHTADWSDDISATEGAMYYISAIDSWNGRVIWRIPLGRGSEFCHDYGGIYFNRSIGNGESNGIFMGTRKYLVSIQNRISK